MRNNTTIEIEGKELTLEELYEDMEVELEFGTYLYFRNTFKSEMNELMDDFFNENLNSILDNDKENKQDRGVTINQIKELFNFTHEHLDKFDSFVKKF